MQQTDLQGALNSTGLFLAAMPPSTVRGKVMRAHRKMMMTMVPKGRAAVDCAMHESRPVVCLMIGGYLLHLHSLQLAWQLADTWEERAAGTPWHQSMRCRQQHEHDSSPECYIWQACHACRLAVATLTNRYQSFQSGPNLPWHTAYTYNNNNRTHPALTLLTTGSLDQPTSSLPCRRWRLC
jgi:hypothetical protein